MAEPIDAPIADAPDPDAPPPVDAAVDAPIDAPAPPTHTELTGGGRMTGGAFVMDVQLGHPTGQAPASGGTTVLHPAAVVRP